MDLTNKTVLIWDLSGSYTFLAEVLTQDFGMVRYASQWESGFPRATDFLPGVGLEFERVADPFEHLDNTDLVIFPDVGLAGLQEFLRSRGMRVWGSGAAAELERDRIIFKQKLQAQEMDVGDYEVITGLDALRRYLAGMDDVWVKISYFRGVTETHQYKAGISSDAWLDQLAVDLGPAQYTMFFLVEQPIEGDACEPGIDIFCVNGQFPDSAMWGYETKDAGYFGCCDVTLPDRLKTGLEQFKPVLADYDYRGPMSVEMRSTDDGRDYWIDFTARFPCPGSESWLLNVKNRAEIMFEGARGLLVEPEYSYRYAAQYVLKSDVLEKQSIGIHLGMPGAGMPGAVLVHGHCRVESRDYAVSPNGIEEFAAAVGLGDTREEACQMAFEAAESVEGDRVTFAADALKDALESIERGEIIGLNFGEE